MDSLKNLYQSSWESIIKPFRYMYGTDNLGPPMRFIGEDTIIRDDFEIKNDQE